MRLVALARSRARRATLLVLLAAGCQSPLALDAPVMDTDVVTSLTLGQMRTIRGTALTLRFAAVPEASLCPPLSMCVWAGTGSATLVIAPAAPSWSGPPSREATLRVPATPAETMRHAGVVVEFVGMHYGFGPADEPVVVADVIVRRE
jgi:hypothetical protein